MTYLSIAASPTATRCWQNKSLRALQVQWWRKPLDVDISSTVLPCFSPCWTLAFRLNALLSSTSTSPSSAICLPYLKLDLVAKSSSMSTFNKAFSGFISKSKFKGQKSKIQLKIQNFLCFKLNTLAAIIFDNSVTSINKTAIFSLSDISVSLSKPSQYLVSFALLSEIS